MHARHVICLITVFILAISSPLVYGQIWLANESVYSEAEEFLQAEEFEEALPLFILLEKKEYVTANIQYKIGECYLNLPGRKLKSIPYLEAAVKKTSLHYEGGFEEQQAPLRAFMLLGVAYRIEGRYDEAISQFKVLKDSTNSLETAQLADIHIARCEHAKLFSSVNNIVEFSEVQAISSQASVYNPVLPMDESKLFYMEKLKFYDAIMKLEDEGSSEPIPENLTPILKSDGDHVLVGASKDGSELFFYLFNNENAGDIYSARYENGEWSQIMPLKGDVNSKYHETSASLSADGETLFFASNREGGLGGLDIYSATKQDDGSWGNVKNLGQGVNTAYNDEYPAIDESGKKLYFCSQGHQNMGGYDVFMSVNDGEWGAARNMMPPISSSDDDLLYYPVNNAAYMSKLDDNVSGGFRIYRFMASLPDSRVILRGEVSAPQNGLVEDIQLTVSDGNGSFVTTPDLNSEGEFITLLDEGLYEVAYAYKEWSAKQQVQVKSSPYASNTLLGSPQWIKTVMTDQADTLLADSLPEPHKPSILLRDILFAFDSYKLPESSLSFLDSLAFYMDQSPNKRITLMGHTDNRGPNQYNLILSKRRALAVKSYLGKQGVDLRIITIEARGEEVPKAINQNPDNTDNPLGRSYNRRVEVQVLEKDSSIKRIDAIPPDLRISK